MPHLTLYNFYSIIYTIPNILFDYIILKIVIKINNQKSEDVRYRTKFGNCTDNFMDRRQKKTRDAIFSAFIELLGKQKWKKSERTVMTENVIFVPITRDTVIITITDIIIKKEAV